MKIEGIEFSSDNLKEFNAFAEFLRDAAARQLKLATEGFAPSIF